MYTEATTSMWSPNKLLIHLEEIQEGNWRFHWSSCYPVSVNISNFGTTFENWNYNQHANMLTVVACTSGNLVIQVQHRTQKLTIKF